MYSKFFSRVRQQGTVCSVAGRSNFLPNEHFTKNWNSHDTMCAKEERDLSREILSNFLRMDIAKSLTTSIHKLPAPKTIPNFFMQSPLFRATREIANLRDRVTCEAKGECHVRQNSNQGERTGELLPWSELWRLQKTSASVVDEQNPPCAKQPPARANSPPASRRSHSRTKVLPLFANPAGQSHNTGFL